MSINSTVGRMPGGKSYQYESVELRTIDLVDSPDKGLEVSFDEERPCLLLARTGFESLCEQLKVPIRFADRLQREGRNHVLSYLQKQLSQNKNKDLTVVVCEKDEVKAFTEPARLPFRGKQIYDLDKAVLEYMKNDPDKELVGRVDADGILGYKISFGPPREMEDDPEGSEWTMGYIFNYSVYGLEESHIVMYAERADTGGVVQLPAEAFEHTFKVRVREGEEEPDPVKQFLEEVEELEEPNWNYLRGYIKKLSSVGASMRELREVRSKLNRTLKVDKDDIGTAERINEALDWEEINEAYGLKELKPSRNWYIRASTPKTLFEVTDVLIREATHAPNTVPVDKIRKLNAHATKLLKKVPDLAEKPPKMPWEKHVGK